MRYTTKIILFIFFIFVLFFPQNAKALPLSSQGLVPCGRPDSPECKLCHIFILIKNVLDFAIKAVFFLATLIILISGIILTTGVSATLATQGKKAIYSAVIGIIITLSAWVIINSIMVLLTNPDTFPFPWNEIKCQ